MVKFLGKLNESQTVLSNDMNIIYNIATAVQSTFIGSLLTFD